MRNGSIFFEGAVRSTGNRRSVLPFVYHTGCPSPSQLARHVSQVWIGQTCRSWAVSKAFDSTMRIQGICPRDGAFRLPSSDFALVRYQILLYFVPFLIF